MFPSQTIEFRHQPLQTISPSMVAFASLLALPGPELEREVAKELDENPVLVVDEVVRSRGAADRTLDTGTWDVAATPTWRETLVAELRLELPTTDEPLAEILVGCLDAHGFLVDPPDEAARAIGLDPARAIAALETLRAVGPAGIGARDAREAMLLQLARRPDGEDCRALATAIVESHLEAVAAGRSDVVAAGLGVTADDVAAAVEYLRAHTRPRPSLSADTADTVWVRPDVAYIERADAPGRYRVAVLERGRVAVAVDPELRAAAGMTGDRRLRGLVERAESFVERLEERWVTLGRVAALVADRQAGYLQAGEAAAVRLTRSEVATALGVHESTVSRATAGKYARLPSGRSIPFAAFFDGAAGARAALQAIIEAEPAALSDAELGRRLAAAGHVVARRTVAKYRDHLGFPAGRVVANRASQAAKAASALG